jgi:hypothetical protein
MTIFNLKPHAKSHRQAFLEILNRLNINCLLSTYAVTEDWTTLEIRSSDPDYYSRTAFGIFLNQLETERTGILTNTPDMLNFAV